MPTKVLSFKKFKESFDFKEENQEIHLPELTMSFEALRKYLEERGYKLSKNENSNI